MNKPVRPIFVKTWVPICNAIITDKSNKTWTISASSMAELDQALAELSGNFTFLTILEGKRRDFQNKKKIEYR